MRTSQLPSWLRSVAERFGSTTRRVWWTSFVLVALLVGLWSVANPPYAGPDEPSHVIRAVALDHGELTGKTPDLQQRRKLRRLAGERRDLLVVHVPEIYYSASNLCFPYHPDITAGCLRFKGSTRDVDAGTYVARHPPAYYGVIGAVSWVYPPGSGAVYLMRFLSVLITSALIATAVTALRRMSAPPVAAVGLVFAVTPMVLFVSSVVNPSATEIAAALALWVCGLALLSRAHEHIDKGLVISVGIAGCVLALSRQLGPLWILLIALSMLVVANRAALRNLARYRFARLWAALIAACSLAQVGWNVIANSLEVTRSGSQRADIDTSEIVRISLGSTLARSREMIGWFGWLDTPAPAITWVPWIAGIGFLVLSALLWARRRYVAALIGLVAVVIVVPVVIESAAYRSAGGLSWQGRYTLPLAVGIPILAASGLAATERGRRLFTARLVSAIGVIIGVAHVIAFAQNLRRYTVGYDGRLQFWKDTGWTAPVSPLLLTIAYAVATGAFVVWMLAVVPRSAARHGSTSPRTHGSDSHIEKTVPALRQA